MERIKYVPERGDIVYTSFSPTMGREQRGRRHALVISAHSYNVISELSLLCPITSTIRNNPFVTIINTSKVKGAILSDQVRSMSWKKRGVKFICKCPTDVLQEVSGKLSVLVQGE